MSEEYSQPTEEQLQDNKPRILELLPAPTLEVPNGVKFTIVEGTTGRDVLATLQYLEPDTIRRQEYLSLILRHGIKEYRILDNAVLRVSDPVGVLSEQVEVERRVRFGDNPTYEDFQKGISATYLDDASRLGAEENVFMKFVDNGKFKNKTIVITNRNEVVTANENDIVAEMAALTIEFRDGQEPQ